MKPRRKYQPQHFRKRIADRRRVQTGFSSRFWRFISLNVLHRVILGISCLLVMQIAFEIFVLPFFVLKNISIESQIALSQSEILRLAQLKGNEYYFFLIEEKIRRNIERHPLVGKVEVKKHFPHGLDLRLYKREAVVLAFARQGEESVPLLVDEDGLIFRLGSETLQEDAAVLTGFEFVRVVEGLRFAQPYRGFLRALGVLKRELPWAYHSISEIRPRVGAEGGIEDFVLYLSFVKTPIYFSDLSLASFVRVFLGLELLRSRGLLDSLRYLKAQDLQLVYALGRE